MGLTVLAQITYPLVGGGVRSGLTVATVVLGFAAAVTHAAVTRGVRPAAVVVVVTAGGGLVVEAVGTATGVPFGEYTYASSLGPAVLGVPWVIPLAWTMMAWPAWLVAGRLASAGWLRVLVSGWALASWDLFLDPQMVDAGHWTWATTDPALPGVPGIPLSNYAGWLLVAVVMSGLLQLLHVDADARHDAPMLGFYLWTYASSVLAHAAFFGLPASAAWGGLGMGLVAIPLAVTLYRDARHARAPRPTRLASTR
ncbi:carotenoid biosynthesis protein [Cryptosporangium aurantiacum]|uniref:carotenoid biosynthesis protein n=1 Tax=Cryptosporangium aurantiacum TaxID=134849 RepID=UPI001C49D06D|nr:carotenoid biosynthesis protein [Cryptosporangium aurantiacum]